MKFLYNLGFCITIAGIISCKSTFAEAVSKDVSMNARIDMLEKALAPESPKALAHLFAEANKTRNGAVQYMLFSQSLKKNFKDSWPYWVSGTSSPWIKDYTVKVIQESNKVWTYKIQYQWLTAAGPFKPDLVQQIKVEPVLQNANSSQKFWITAFKEEDKS